MKKTKKKKYKYKKAYDLTIEQINVFGGKGWRVATTNILRGEGQVVWFYLLEKEV